MDGWTGQSGKSRSETEEREGARNKTPRNNIGGIMYVVIVVVVVGGTEREVK